MLDFIRSKTFLLNLAMAVAIVSLFLVGTYLWLGAYTKHGETVSVPNLKGKKFEEIDKFLEGKQVKAQISDSTVFMLDKPPGTIVEQDPAPGEKVKEGRTIYLTITRTVPPQVKLPNLIDVSKRQAEAILASFGLKIGQITYKPDLAKDVVLFVQQNGRDIIPGQDLQKGAVIDLVLGDGFGNTKIQIPTLIGLTLDEAMFVLKGSSLNFGALIFDETVKDSSEAKVYRQDPLPSAESIINQGDAIDLYFTQSLSKLR